MSTVFLIGNDNAADGSTTFTDQSLAPHTVTAVGNAQYDTAQAPTGMTSSMLFDGTGDWLTNDGSADFAFGTGDFTIEFMVRFASLTGTPILYDSRPTGGITAYPTIYVSGSKLIYFTVNGNRITGGTTMSTGTWYHVAVARAGTSTKLFLAGTQEGSTYSDSNTYINGTGRPILPANGAGGGTFELNGHMACLRVDKGTALYTANFTPPSLPLSVLPLAGHPASRRFGGVRAAARIPGVW